MRLNLYLDGQTFVFAKPLFHHTKEAMKILLRFLCFCLIWAKPIYAQPVPAAPDSTQLLRDLQWLSSDALQGRRVMTAGNEAAAAYLVAVYERLGLKKFENTYRVPFTTKRGSAELKGQNIVGYLTGTKQPQTWMVISAHFDHLGNLNGKIFNGADDNASGTAALLQIAAYFAQNPPAHSIIFAAFDAEEMGLKGADAFIKAPPVPIGQIALNLNMDMISRNDKNELYVSGAHPYPFLKPIVKTATQNAKVKVLFGHDTPTDQGANNWVSASDHGVFHGRGIPFLYFGVEDHPDYHQPTDDFERIMPRFYFQVVRTILEVAKQADAELDSILMQRK